MDNNNHITSPQNRVLIVADCHVPLDNRIGGEERRSAFINFLDHYRKGTKHIILLGDIFDFWYEWKHVVPKRVFPLFNLLCDLTKSDTKIHYFAGNHDFKLQGFLEDEIGLSIHLDEWTTTFDNKKYYFHHGDGMANSDVSYRLMKKVFRSKIAQTLFGSIVHPDLAMQLGKKTSDLGREKHNNGNKREPLLREYLLKAQDIINDGNDVVVFGHSHELVNENLNGGLFHNPGPFLGEGRFSVIEGGLPKSGVWK
jgi:UDP-2,3-diacylglucosamine hydrolase